MGSRAGCSPAPAAPCPAAGTPTLLPLSALDSKPPASHEQGLAELLRITVRSLASLTHPWAAKSSVGRPEAVSKQLKAQAAQSSSSSKLEHTEHRGPSGSQARCQAQRMPVGSRHRNALTEAWKSKPLGERTSFYSTFVPGEMEPRSRHLFPGSPALLPPHSRTQHNSIHQSSAAPARLAGSPRCISPPCTAWGQLHHGTFTRTIRVLPKLGPDLSGHRTLIRARRNSLAPKIHSLSQQTEKKTKFVLRGKKNRGWLMVCTA